MPDILWHDDLRLEGVCLRAHCNDGSRSSQTVERQPQTGDANLLFGKFFPKVHANEEIFLEDILNVGYAFSVGIITRQTYENAREMMLQANLFNMKNKIKSSAVKETCNKFFPVIIV